MTDWEPADILAFSGRSVISGLIRLGTCSQISHVGILSWTSSADLKKCFPLVASNWKSKLLLYESTTLNNLPCAIRGAPFKGVQAQVPEQRIDTYDGKCWLYRLAPAWREEFTATKKKRLTKLLIQELPQTYDSWGVRIAFFRWCHCLRPLFPWEWFRGTDRARFCSEMLAGVLPHVGLLAPGNPTRYTPGSLMAELIENEVYLPAVEVKA